MMIRSLLFLSSGLIVAFGQSAFIWWLGPLAACCGFALFWRILLDISSPSKRFVLGAAWFGAIQLIQLSWALWHPFLYIYAAYAAVCLYYGSQFGLLCLLVTRERVASRSFPFLIAALWTLLEWSRLFILSGFTWNPVGLALTSNHYSLQLASVAGIYGLSFWVIFINGLWLQVWMNPLFRRSIRNAIAIVLTSFPFMFGFAHLAYHENQQAQQPSRTLDALLVQTHFPVEEWLPQYTPREAFRLALEEWGRILQLVQPYQSDRVDLVLLPENVVPFAAYSPIYTHESVKNLFRDTLGTDSLASLPELETAAAMSIDTPNGKMWLVTNGYVAQAMANWLQANVVIGLEDRETDEDGTSRSYASAFYFTLSNPIQEKYNKRILVPGEYIPFAIVAPLMRAYGIHWSLTPGILPKIIHCRDVPMGISICYEETFGELMRDNRLQGAELILNLTNDGWYPNSRLPHHHFEHSRPRSVELGVPLVRACNTGFTCVVDSLGRVVVSLDDIHRQGALKTKIPLYHYQTLYAQFGDGLAVVGSALIGLVAWLRRLFSTFGPLPFI